MPDSPGSIAACRLPCLLAVALAAAWACSGESPPPAELDHGKGPPAPQCVPAAGDPDHEPLETRCDGIDNDCDGLTDVLLPKGPNACATGLPGACSSAWALCEEGRRLCVPPPPGPETANGVDDDCNGVIDDVPGPVSLRPRLWVIPPAYLLDEGGQVVIDSITEGLEQWGIPYDVAPPAPGFTGLLPELDRYAALLVPGYLLGTELGPDAIAAFESFAAAGGVVVVAKPVDNGAPSLLRFCGVYASTQRHDVVELRIDGASAPAARAFDSPEERTLPITGDPAAEPVEVFVLDPAAAAGTTVVATGRTAGSELVPVIVRRRLGQGAIYSLGHDLQTFDRARCYVNCFEPSGEILPLFLREALREGARGHVVLKHTGPAAADGLLMLTHDIDAPDSHNGGTWGRPGAVQIAEVELTYGARGTFFITTDYVAGYFNPEMPRALCNLGMCPLGAHSVRHQETFSSQELGTCRETPASYHPDPTTLCGEVRVPQQILTGISHAPVQAWRSPFLFLHDSLFEVLAAHGYLVDSSFAIGDLRSNLPVSMATSTRNQEWFHHQPLLEFPIVAEDGIGSYDEHGVEQRVELQTANFWQFVHMWTYILLRNADNGAHLTVLIHPSWGRGMTAANLPNKMEAARQLLIEARERGIPALGVDEVDAWWRGREATALDASYDSGSGYHGTLRTGDIAPVRFTLAFGDDIASFSCPTCGTYAIRGGRVTLAGPLAAHTTHAFTAVPVGTPER